MNSLNENSAVASDLLTDETCATDCPVAHDWLCTNGRCWKLPSALSRAIGRLSETLTRLLPRRVNRNTWIRYWIGLDRYPFSLASLPSPPGDVRLTRIDDAIIRQLRAHPHSDRNQMISAFRFWERGLRNAYIWLQDGEPMCFLWLFVPQNNPQLRRLPQWSGMYPPLPSGWGQFENVFTFARGLRRPGGAATDFAHAVICDAKKEGLTGLITHMHEHNVMARRWAERTGYRAYGVITRYQLDLPGLRRFPWYVHRVCNVANVGTGLPRPSRNLEAGERHS